MLEHSSPYLSGSFAKGPGGIGTESHPVAGLHWAVPSTALDKMQVNIIIRWNKKIIQKYIGSVNGEGSFFARLLY